MGLDIYLYQYGGDFDTIKAQEKAYDEAEEPIWSRKYEGDEDAQRAARKADIAELRKKHGYVGDGNKTYERFFHPQVSMIERDSALHPDHLFKVGYFRSSYNAGGIDSVCRQNGAGDLYYVMGYPDRGGPYEFRPDWKLSLKRAKQEAQRLRDIQASGKALRVTFEAALLPDKMAKSKEQALAIVLDQFFPKGEPRKDPFGDDSGWSNAMGMFFPKGLKVLAVLPGVEESIFAKLRGEKGWTPGAYVVTAEDLEWYAKAYDIVAETCEFVLASPDPSQFLVHWSG